MNFANSLLRLVPLFLVLGCLSSSPYSVDDLGRLHYGVVSAKLLNATVVSQNASVRIEKIYLDVGDGTLAAMLWTPVGKPAGPALLFHPGAGVGKEAGRAYAEMMLGRGFSVMSLDQRGFGESLAPTYSGDADFVRFKDHLEPTEHRRVYDAMAAYDYLSHRQEVDPQKIVLVGESLGGRVMLMAASQLPTAKALVVISSSGYGMRQGNDVESTRYLHSIDAENYAPLSAQKPAYVLHSRQDPIIPFDQGRALFARMGEPKAFVEIPCPNHGYCKEMEPTFNSIMAKLFP